MNRHKCRAVSVKLQQGGRLSARPERPRAGRCSWGAAASLFPPAKGLGSAVLGL